MKELKTSHFLKLWRGKCHGVYKKPEAGFKFQSCFTTGRTTGFHLRQFSSLPLGYMDDKEQLFQMIDKKSSYNVVLTVTEPPIKRSSIKHVLSFTQQNTSADPLPHLLQPFPFCWTVRSDPHPAFWPGFPSALSQPLPTPFPPLCLMFPHLTSPQTPDLSSSSILTSMTLRIVH